MPDKLPDAEIIKALECCKERVQYEGNENTCCSCSLITDDSCTCTLAKYALDLINRQKAEIERLNFVRTRDKQRHQEKTSDQAHTNCILIDLHSQAIKEVKGLEEKLETANAEIKRLEDSVKGFEKIRRAYQRYLYEGEIEGFEKLFKAEAYKECIARVKEEYADLMEFGYADISVDGLFKTLDNLLKEMVGDGE